MNFLKNGERIDYIFADKLKIIQENNEFSFSLDSLLLGSQAVSLIKDRFHVADLCCGNGACSLYMAYFNRAHYDAVEIQADVADQARRSVALNQMENRINIVTGDAKNSGQLLQKDFYDVVVINPPYFKMAAGHKINPASKKAIARHELKINLEQAIASASALLKMKGKMIMVHRPERLGEIMYYCIKHDLPVKTVQPYVSHRGENANLIVVEAVKHTAGDGLVLRDAQVVHQADGSYQPAIKQLLASPQDTKRKYYFYVLLCHDGSFYGGFTTDLAHRLKMHNAGKGAKYTKSRRPVKMIYHESFPDKRLALKREYWFKHHPRHWKESFLRQHGVL